MFFVRLQLQSCLSKRNLLSFSKTAKHFELKFTPLPPQKKKSVEDSSSKNSSGFTWKNLPNKADHLRKDEALKDALGPAKDTNSSVNFHWLTHGVPPGRCSGKSGPDSAETNFLPFVLKVSACTPPKINMEPGK